MIESNATSFFNIFFVFRTSDVLGKSDLPNMNQYKYKSSSNDKYYVYYEYFINLEDAKAREKFFKIGYFLLSE